MPDLFGRAYSRSELLRRVGRLEQVAGVRLVTLDDRLAVRDEFRRALALAEPLAELDAWLEPYRSLWTQRLDHLQEHLERKEP